jgi:WS/DGAT/MGAT family acyltransferase
MSTRRRLSPLDAAFLYFEKPHQRLHVGCVAVLDGSVGFPAFGVAMGERLGAVARYRQRPVRPLLDLDWPRWEEDPAFDVQRHLHHVAVPGPGGEAELHALVDRLFATALDEAHPLWETYLIDGLAGGRSALLCKVHHSMIDGVSGAQLIEVMSDGERGRSHASPATATIPRGGRVLEALSTVRTILRTAASPRAVLAHARDALDAARTLAPLFLEPVSDLPFNGRLTDVRRIVWASFALDDFLAMRGVEGCKVNDVVLAVIAGALRRYVEGCGVPSAGLRMRTLVPVSVRRSEDHLTLGNLVSSLFPTLPVDVAEPVERLRRVAAEMRHLKEQGQARATGWTMQLAGALPAPVSALLGRLLPENPLINTVCTNVPGPREACQILGRSIVDVHPIVPLFQNMGMEFAILSYAGRLSITAVVDPHLVPDADTIPALLQDEAAALGRALGLGAARRPSPPTPGLRVADLMTRDVLTIGQDESLVTAYALMQERRIRHLPVVDPGGRLVGLVTHRDLLAASSSSLGDPGADTRVRLPAWARARDVMETHLSLSAPDDPAVATGERMIRHKIGCLPVVGPDARLAGIVTEVDFLRWATAHMTSAAAGCFVA